MSISQKVFAGGSKQNLWLSPEDPLLSCAPCRNNLPVPSTQEISLGFSGAQLRPFPFKLNARILHFVSIIIRPAPTYPLLQQANILAKHQDPASHSFCLLFPEWSPHLA